MKYSVMDRNKAVGSCHLEKDGLYWQLDCRCSMEKGIVRLYAQLRCVGVLQPDGEWLCLKRRLSCSGWPELPPQSGYFTLSPLTPMEPWQGTVLDLPMPEGFQRREGPHTVLLFPFSADQPCPCSALLCFFSVKDGYWQLHLNENGKPVF